MNGRRCLSLLLRWWKYLLTRCRSTHSANDPSQKIVPVYNTRINWSECNDVALRNTMVNFPPEQERKRGSSSRSPMKRDRRLWGNCFPTQCAPCTHSTLLWIPVLLQRVLRIDERLVIEACQNEFAKRDRGSATNHGIQLGSTLIFCDVCRNIEAVRREGSCWQWCHLISILCAGSNFL